ncbi:MAG: hypothetical protein NVSMB27_41790 [Ktedonobacteraceae bacterium]
MYGVQKGQLGWYEATLPLQERRSRGHFSTPPLLVEHILDACGYTPDKDLTNIRVLDPACGSGNFIAAAARRLLAFATHTHLPAQESISLVQHNLWGFDPDPISCFLAQMQLSAAIENEIGTRQSSNTPATGRAQEITPTLLHIHQADGLALPWSEPCVDLFLANPPYLAAKNTDLSGYRSAQRRGQVDSYLLFLSLGLQIVRPHGWLGLVLPDPVLARTNAAAERTHLLKAFTIHHLWHLSGVFSAQVGVAVIIAQKSPPKSQHHLSWVREKWGTRGAKGLAPSDPTTNGRGERPCAPTVPQSLFLKQPRAEFRYLLSTGQGPIIEQLRTCLDETPGTSSRFAPLADFLSLRRGEELGRTSSHLMHHPTLVPTGAITCDDIHCRCHKGMYPILRGGKDIRPYGTPCGQWCIAREAITKPLERYLSPKLLVVKSTGHLQATLDLQGHVALQTLYLLHLKEKDAGVDDLYFFLALLNSRLLQQYVYMLHTAYKWVQPQIEQHVLARLPIPIIAPGQKKEIIEHAKLLVRACSQSGTVVEWKEELQNLYEEQERAVCRLYNSYLED